MMEKIADQKNVTSESISAELEVNNSHLQPNVVKIYEKDLLVIFNTTYPTAVDFIILEQPPEIREKFKVVKIDENPKKRKIPLM